MGRVRWILWGAMAVAAGTWFTQQSYAFGAHRLQWGQDLAFFHQIFHSAVTGGPWTSPLLLEPTGFFDMVHFHPLFAFVMPVFALWRDPHLLLLLNVLAVVATAWPLALLGRDVSRSDLFGVAAGCAWLAWVPAACAARADFRPMVFLIPGLAWLLVGVWRRRRLEWLGGALLCVLAREESSYVLIAGGAALALLPFDGRRRREGLVLVLIGGIWMAFLLAFKENFFFHFDPVEAVRGWNSRPAVESVLVQDRTGFVLKAWLGGYLGAPLAPVPLAFGLGPATWLWMDPHREWHALMGTTVYLRDPLLPLIAVSGTLAAGWVVRRRPRWELGVASLLLLGNALGFWGDRGRLSEIYEGYREEALGEEARDLWRLVETVPDEARVATDYRLVAALSGRAVLWNVAHLYMDDGRPHHWEGDWPLTLDLVDALVVSAEDPILERLTAEWSLKEEAAGYGYWSRSP